MNLLIDTHTFLWFVTGDPQLAESHQTAIRDPANLVVLSSVSAAEIAIKHSLNKLPLPESPVTLLPRLRRLHQIAELPLDEAASLALTNLPLLHKDPFDRLLICQALVHGFILVTDDDLIRQYDVPIL